jgi:hypothetical protein
LHSLSKVFKNCDATKITVGGKGLEATEIRLGAAAGQLGKES